MALAFHHVAAVTRDADVSSAWYQHTFALRPIWTLRSFSPLTKARLPGLTRIDELAVPGLRIHLMEVPGTSVAPDLASFALFQHTCVAVDSRDELRALQERAATAKGSAAAPTEIVVDNDGVESFYAKDPDALEWEVTWVPAGVQDR